MKKFLRFMKSEEASPGIITIVNSIVVYVIHSTVADYSLKGTIIYFAVMETIAIVSLIIGYMVWKKGGKS